MKLGTADIHTKIFSKCKSQENKFTLREKVKFLFILYNSLSIWIKFNIADLLEMPLSNCELREKWHSENHNLFRGVSEIIAYVLHSSSQLDKIFFKDFHKN